MKRLFFILVLLPCYSFGQNYIDSLEILPQNPDSSDIVKVVCYATFPTSGCTLDSSEIILGPFEVTINAYYTMGIGQAFCTSIDTITIGKLAIGNYVLFYNSNTNYDTIVEIDSINFTVALPNSLSEINTLQQLKICPNPTEGKFRVESSEFRVEKIEVFDVFGRVVYRYVPLQPVNQLTINLSTYPAGIYMVRAGEAVRKLIVH